MIRVGTMLRKGLPARRPARRGLRAPARGSVLIIVIWVCLGLVALTVYFAGSMSSELRAADNRAAEVVARQAAAGGTRYAAFILSQFATRGAVPHREDYQSEDLPVGDASFWFIGRDQDQTPGNDPVFGLVDEASKINLKTADRRLLEALPGMTPEFVDSILAWRTRSSQGGGTDNIYSRLDPPRLNKSAQFETIDELRLVYGSTLEILFGEDTNRNGALDENENDGERSAPRDNSDGLIQPGILEYVTVYSSEPNRRANGGQRINIATQQNRQQSAFINRLQAVAGPARATAIQAALGNAQLRSVAEFWIVGRLTAQEFARLRDDVTTSGSSTLQGLINVNTASETVLSCIPGIGPEYASAIVAYRLSHPDVLTTFTWLTDVMPRGAITTASRYITDRSYQFCADVAAVGNNGRGYCRLKTIFDMTRGTPRIVFQQDLTAYGWALGAQVRQLIKEGRRDRT